MFGSGHESGFCAEKPMTAPKAAPIDRRVARTRRTLQRALLSLMLKKGYDAVTVEDICAEADVGRSTFYAHFTGKEDLKRSGLDDNLKRMLIERQKQAKAQGSGEGRFAFALLFFEHARDHLDLYRALVSKGGAPTTMAMMRQIATEMVRRELGSGAREVDAPREAVVQFVVGAFISVLTWWLDTGAKLPAQRVDAIFRRLVTKGVPAEH
jgi:AcrR family transcriptional regulator